jgi:ElaB/YqjD/DUF883 family membrane-anchored ribosome-binding protein
MGQEPSAGGTPVTAADDPEEIERQIQQTRDELGETVEALAHKTDVKAQARNKFEQTKASVNQKKDELLGKARDRSPDSAASAAAQASTKARENPLPLAAAGAFAVGFLAGRITKA